MEIGLTRGNKPSSVTHRQRKSIKEKDICFNCKKEFQKWQLEVEHEIPVCLGSDVELYRIFCKQCHKEKTRKDVLIIHFFKKAGILIKIGCNTYEILIKKEEIQELYHKLFNLVQ